MKIIEGYGCYQVNNQLVLLVSDDYKGSPLICYEYDILVCSQKVFNKYHDELIQPHTTKLTGWYPKIIIQDPN